MKVADCAKQSVKVKVKGHVCGYIYIPYTCTCTYIARKPHPRRLKGVACETNVSLTGLEIGVNMNILLVATSYLNHHRIVGTEW